MEELENKKPVQEEIIMLGASLSPEETPVIDDKTNNVSDEMKPLEEVLLENTSNQQEEAFDTQDSETLVEESVTNQAEEKDIKETATVVTAEEMSSITNNLQALNDKVEQMNQLFQQKIAHTTHEEKIVDQMHAELQKYKQDMYAQLVRPILLDMIDMRDSIVRMSANFAKKPEGEQNVPLQTFSGYSYDVQDILEKNNVSIYDSKEGDDFNPLKQKAIKKVTTPVEVLHGKIAESLSSGYEYLGKTISPEKVVVYVYQKPENEEGE